MCDLRQGNHARKRGQPRAQSVQAVWNPNLQRVRARVDGKAKNIDVCTRCLRGNKVVKAVRGRRVPVTA